MLFWLWRLLPVPRRPEAMQINLPRPGSEAKPPGLLPRRPGQEPVQESRVASLRRAFTPESIAKRNPGGHALVQTEPRIQRN